MTRRQRLIVIAFGDLRLSRDLAVADPRAGRRGRRALEGPGRPARPGARGRGGVLARLPECRRSPTCAQLVRAPHRAARRPGAVQILNYEPSVQVTLTNRTGRGRVAWRTREERFPVVQCVFVRREGPLILRAAYSTRQRLRHASPLGGGPSLRGGNPRPRAPGSSRRHAAGLRSTSTCLTVSRSSSALSRSKWPWRSRGPSSCCTRWFDIAGVERIPNRGPAIIVANHRSYFDITVMAMLFRRRAGPVRFLGKKEVFDVPVVGQVAKAFGGIRVDRGPGRTNRCRQRSPLLHRRPRGDHAAGHDPARARVLRSRAQGSLGSAARAHHAGAGDPCGAVGYREGVAAERVGCPNVLNVTNPPTIRVRLVLLSSSSTRTSTRTPSGSWRR